MYKISKKSEYFLYKYLTTGSEVDAQKIWMKYIKQYSDSIEIDNYGTVVGIINKKKPFQIVIEAHIYEISLYVNYITDDGFIYVAGGTDNKIATSKRVNIHTKNGIIDGLFVLPAIKSPNIKKFFIDIGASNKKEVEYLGINVGCLVTYTDNFFIMNNKYFVGSALNNKIGGFIIAEVMRLIKENNVVFPYGLYVINYVKNTKIIRINPNLAIRTDVCNDTYTTMIDKKINGDVKCGLGPVISYSPSIHNNLREKIIDIANKNNLDFQRLVSPICTGPYNGVIYALISIPIRYMHTTVEMANKKDIENCIHLMFETLKSIYSNKNFKYL